MPFTIRQAASAIVSGLFPTPKMNKRPYKFTTSVSIGGDQPTWEGEITFGYSVHWGSPEVGRGPGCPPELYDPGEPSIVEEVTLVAIEGHERPWHHPYQTDAELEQQFLPFAEGLEEEMIRAAADVEESRRAD